MKNTILLFFLLIATATNAQLFFNVFKPCSIELRDGESIEEKVKYLPIKR